MIHSHMVERSRKHQWIAPIVLGTEESLGHNLDPSFSSLSWENTTHDTQVIVPRKTKLPGFSFGWIQGKSIVEIFTTDRFSLNHSLRKMQTCPKPTFSVPNRYDTFTFSVQFACKHWHLRGAPIVPLKSLGEVCKIWYERRSEKLRDVQRFRLKNWYQCSSGFCFHASYPRYSHRFGEYAWNI